MSELSRQQRDRLPASAFALPEERRFPIHDEAHARNALARVSQFGTPAEKTQVRAAVHKRYPNIGKQGPAPHGKHKRRPHGRPGRVHDPDGIPNNGDEYRIVNGKKVPVKK